MSFSNGQFALLYPVDDSLPCETDINRDVALVSRYMFHGTHRTAGLNVMQCWYASLQLRKSKCHTLVHRLWTTIHGRHIYCCKTHQPVADFIGTTSPAVDF